MYCRYDMTAKVDTGNSVTVIADCWEGTYQDVEDPITHEVENQFVRENRFATVSAFFEKNPVSEEEEKEKLLALLIFVKGDREIVSELA